MFPVGEKWFPSLIEHKTHPLGVSKLFSELFINTSWHMLRTLRFLSLRCSAHSLDVPVLSTSVWEDHAFTERDKFFFHLKFENLIKSDENLSEQIFLTNSMNPTKSVIKGLKNTIQSQTVAVFAENSCSVFFNTKSNTPSAMNSMLTWKPKTIIS